MRSNLKLIWALLIVAFPAGAFGQTLLPVTVSDDEARVTIELPGGIGAELTIAFEDVVGLCTRRLSTSRRRWSAPWISGFSAVFRQV